MVTVCQSVDNRFDQSTSAEREKEKKEGERGKGWREREQKRLIPLRLHSAYILPAELLT